MTRFITALVLGLLLVMMARGAQDAGNTAAAAGCYVVAAMIAGYMMLGGSARRE
jgi:hypothetical protein